MKMVVWNCQGLEGSLAVSQLEELCNLHNPDVVFISETKNNAHFIRTICRRIKFQDFCVVDPIGLSGGLALFWNQGQSMEYDDHFGNLGRKITQHMNNNLMRPISEIEVRRAVFGMKSHSAPGPDVAEALNILAETAVEKNISKGIKVNNEGINITHLQFADDTIFFGDWDLKNMGNLRRIMKIFAIVCLNINLRKSNLFGINVQQYELLNGVNALGCSSGTLPYKYLGMPAGRDMSRSSAWQPIIDRIKKNWPGGRREFNLLGEDLC